MLVSGRTGGPRVGWKTTSRTCRQRVGVFRLRENWRASNLGLVAPIAIIDVALVGAAAIDESYVSAENGYVENLQLLILFVTTLILISASNRQAGAAQSAAVALAGIAFAFFFRELDFRDFDLPEHVRLLTSAGVRDVVFIAMILGVLVYMFMKRRWLWDWIWMVLTPRAVALIGAALFIAMGHVLDDIYGKTIWEEIFESNGYILLLVASIRHHRLR